MRAGGKDHFHLVCLFQQKRVILLLWSLKLVSLCWAARCV